MALAQSGDASARLASVQSAGTSQRPSTTWRALWGGPGSVGDAGVQRHLLGYRHRHHPTNPALPIAPQLETHGWRAGPLTADVLFFESLGGCRCHRNMETCIISQSESQ